MVNRFLAYLALALLPGTILQAEAPRRFSHSGVTVDAPTGKPLVDVLATAYASNKRSENAACPKYDEFVDDDVTSKRGTFALRVPEPLTSYVVTYCHAAYVTFTRISNDNTNDGAPIDPNPVRLFPRDGTAAQMFDAIALLRDEVRASIIALSQDHANFAAAVDALPAPERRLVRLWVGTTRGPTSAPAPTGALQKLVDVLRTGLEYFSEASPGDFRDEVRNFEDLGPYVEPALSTLTAIDYLAGAEFSIRITSPKHNSTAQNDRVKIEGAVKLATTTDQAGRPTIDVELKRRNLELVPVVQVVMRSFEQPRDASLSSEEWRIESPLIVQADGTFSGEVLLVDDGVGRAQAFRILVLLAPERTHQRFDKLRQVSEKAMSSSVTVRVNR